MVFIVSDKLKYIKNNENKEIKVKKNMKQISA